MSEGRSTKQIAAELWLSPATVRNHVAATMTALGAHRASRRFAVARRAGLLGPTRRADRNEAWGDREYGTSCRCGAATAAPDGEEWIWMSGRTRDLIVVGASAGGVEPLVTLASDAPGGPAGGRLRRPAHPRRTDSLLAPILDRAGPLRATAAEDGEAIERGRIYVAPPDCHLSLDDVIHVFKGPRENRSRPSVDVLFRSAAQHHGPRVIGVVLSGMLEDGTAGLAAIKDAGGIAIVQEPDETSYPGMPRSASPKSRWITSSCRGPSGRA